MEVPRGNTTRKLEAFALHARLDNRTVDYPALFGWFSSREPEDRFHEFGGRLIAIPRLKIERGRVILTAYEGEAGLNPLIFNVPRARERIQRLRSGEVLATKTHCLIDLSKRQAIIEYNHRGAKASDIALVLEELARRNPRFEGVAIELNPVADEAFVAAIERFERIRIASLKVARPNVEWTDHYNNLTAVAADSNARLAEVVFTANRGKSLAKEHGVVQFIKDLAQQTLSILKGARIVGAREGETSETTVSLGHHVEHQRVSVRMTEDGHVDDTDIETKMLRYLESRRHRRSPRD